MREHCESRVSFNPPPPSSTGETRTPPRGPERGPVSIRPRLRARGKHANRPRHNQESPVSIRPRLRARGKLLRSRRFREVHGGFNPPPPSSTGETWCLPRFAGGIPCVSIRPRLRARGKLGLGGLVLEDVVVSIRPRLRARGKLSGCPEFSLTMLVSIRPRLRARGKHLRVPDVSADEVRFNPPPPSSTGETGCVRNLVGTRKFQSAPAFEHGGNLGSTFRLSHVRFNPPPPSSTGETAVLASGGLADGYGATFANPYATPQSFVRRPSVSRHISRIVKDLGVSRTLQAFRHHSRFAINFISPAAHPSPPVRPPRGARCECPHPGSRTGSNLGRDPSLRIGVPSKTPTRSGRRCIRRRSSGLVDRSRSRPGPRGEAVSGPPRTRWPRRKPPARTWLPLSSSRCTGRRRAGPPGSHGPGSSPGGTITEKPCRSG